jgi:hypothetical protein
VKIHNDKSKRFYSSNKKGLICWDKSKNHGKLLYIYWWNSRWKLNLKSYNVQTDASCTKLVDGLCYILINLTTFELFVAFSNLNNELAKF